MGAFVGTRNTNRHENGGMHHTSFNRLVPSGLLTGLMTTKSLLQWLTGRSDDVRVPKSQQQHNAILRLAACCCFGGIVDHFVLEAIVKYQTFPFRPFPPLVPDPNPANIWLICICNATQAHRYSGRFVHSWRTMPVMMDWLQEEQSGSGSGC